MSKGAETANGVGNLNGVRKVIRVQNNPSNPRSTSKIPGHKRFANDKNCERIKFKQKITKYQIGRGQYATTV
jgi:hypothetical protein